jgi:hypothetical protein
MYKGLLKDNDIFFFITFEQQDSNLCYQMPVNMLFAQYSI